MRMCVCVPPFSPSVLKPSLDLSVGHLQTLGQGRSLSGGEVLLSVKPLLQLNDLQSGEGRPRLLPLRWRSVLVWVADTTAHYHSPINDN